MHEVELAWALVDVTRGSMQAKERIGVCVAIGSGDTQTAIRRLTSVAIRHRAFVPHDVADALREWWTAYGADGDMDVNLVARSLRRTERTPAASHELRYLSVLSQHRRPGRTRRSRGHQ